MGIGLAAIWLGLLLELGLGGIHNLKLPVSVIMTLRKGGGNVHDAKYTLACVVSSTVPETVA